MSYHEFQTPYNVNAYRWAPGLGGIMDRKAFTAACRTYHDTMKAATDILYPARHDAVQVSLKALGLEPDAANADAIFERCQEAAREEFSAKLAGDARLRFTKEVAPRVKDLMRKLADKIDGIAAELGKRERAEAASFGIPYHESATFLSVEGTARDFRAGIEAHEVWTGDEVTKLLSHWFPEPIELK